MGLGFIVIALYIQDSMLAKPDVWSSQVSWHSSGYSLVQLQSRTHSQPEALERALVCMISRWRALKLAKERLANLISIVFKILGSVALAAVVCAVVKPTTVCNSIESVVRQGTALKQSEWVCECTACMHSMC